MSSLEVRYALPESRIRLSSTVTVTEDTLFGSKTTVPQTVVALEIGATARNRTLTQCRGWFHSTAATLALNEEGRLTSTSIESSGQAGKVVVGVVGAAVSVGSAVLGGGGAGLAAAAASALNGASEARLMAIGQELRQIGEPAPRTPEEIEAAAFAEADPGAAAMRTRYQTLLRSTIEEIAQVSSRLLDAEDREQAALAAKWLASLEAALAVIQARLDALNGLFAAWRATKIETRTETHERLISIEDLNGSKLHTSRRGKEVVESESKAVRKAWSKHGVAVEVRPRPGWEPRGGRRTAGKNEILVRIPRPVILDVYERGPEGEAVLRERKEHLVMDSRCDTEVFKLRRSRWAKRSLTLGFNDLGGLASLSDQSDSAAAAAATTMGELPATVSASLESAAKIRKEIGATGKIEQQLARVKAEAELKQHELTRAGLTATASEAADLDRLKRLAEAIEYGEKIEKGTAEPGLAATEIAELKERLERLKLQTAIAKLGG